MKSFTIPPAPNSSSSPAAGLQTTPIAVAMSLMELQSRAAFYTQLDFYDREKASPDTTSALAEPQQSGHMPRITTNEPSRERLLNVITDALAILEG